MDWLNKHKRKIRIAFLLLLALAILGPWGFDRIHVPAEYSCSPPNIRLEGDFCGLPLSFAWFLSSMGGGLFYLIREAAMGSLRFANLILELRVYLYILPLLFPAVGTAVLVLGGEGRGWRTLHLAGLVVAAGIAVLLAGLGYSTSGWILWRLWGLWLYVLLVISLLVLEIFVWRRPPGTVRKPSGQGTAAV